LEQVVATSFAHVDFKEWTGNRLLATIGTNAGSEPLPFQTWKSFKEAFAPELIERAFRETGDVSRVVDPFGGSGTTALAAQFLGAHPTTIEVNPFLADLIEAKICQYDPDSLVKAYAQVVHAAKGRHVDPALLFASAPKTFVEPGVEGQYLFSASVAGRLSAYRSAIDEVQDQSVARLLRILLASSAVPVSNAVISGKGRRYRRNWESRQSGPNAVDELFEQTVLQAIFDIRRYTSRRCRDYTLLRGDSRQLVGEIGEQDLAIFSPPYPNSFDYTDVYNIELWAMGYLASSDDNRALRNATLRSHVQIYRDMSYRQPASRLLASTLDRLNDARPKLWNRNIPDMVGAYFDDMCVILNGLRGKLREGGRVYMVVGDSRYANIDVPVGAILAEGASALGYELISSEPFRSMRASPQQGGRPELAETLITFRA
jgi:hypothetical protein